MLNHKVYIQHFISWVYTFSQISYFKEAVKGSLENLGGKMHHVVHFRYNGSSRVAVTEHVVVVMYQHTQVCSQAR